MNFSLGGIFKRFTSTAQPEAKTVQPEAKQTPTQTSEQKLHRRDSMLLDLLNLLKEISSLSDEQQIRNKFYDCRGLLTKLHPFAEKDADTASALLKAIDVLADIDLEQSIETLRLMVIDLDAYRQPLADNQINRDLAKKCISLAEQTEFVDEKMAALAYAVEFAPSLSAEAAQVLENLINDMEPKDAIAFISNKFSNKPGNRPAFEAVALAATKKLSETLPPDQELIAQRIIAVHTADSAEQNKAAERWLSLLTSSASLRAAKQELDRQIYDNHYTPKILREYGIRAQLLLADKASNYKEKIEFLRGAAYDNCKSGKEDLSRLAANRWIEYANDDELITTARWGSSHYLNNLAGERILRLADIRKPEDAMQLLDATAHTIETENTGSRPEKFYGQVLQKLIALLKEKIPAEMAFIHLKNLNSQRQPSYYRSHIIGDIFLTLADRLPSTQGAEAARLAYCTFSSGSDKSHAAAQKWADLLPLLPAEQAIEEMKFVRKHLISSSDLYKQMEKLEPELCKKAACGISPADFTRRLAGGPG